MTADTQAQPFCFNFSPTALFSAKPFGYHFCKSKRGALFINCFIWHAPHFLSLLALCLSGSMVLSTANTRQTHFVFY
jgi:hypothetical protein